MRSRDKNLLLDGNKYLKIAFHHAAVRAIQYFPEIQRFYRNLSRRKPKAVARALVANELARAVHFVLTRQEAFNGTFKGQPLSRTKQPRWPRLANPPVQLEPARAGASRTSALLDWGAGVRPSTDLWDRPLSDHEPAMVCGRH